MNLLLGRELDDGVDHGLGASIPGIPAMPPMPSAAAFIWLSESIRKLPEVTTRSPPVRPERSGRGRHRVPPSPLVAAQSSRSRDR